MSKSPFPINTPQSELSTDPQFPTYTIPTSLTASLSTAHITHIDGYLLRKDITDLPWIVAQRPDKSGVIIIVSSEHTEFKEQLQAFQAAGFSTAVLSLLLDLHERDIHFLNLHPDGELIPELPTYHW